MTEQLITVDGKPFLGRIEEQKQFRSALSELLYPPFDEDLPYIFLLYGGGGIGKTTLAKRFRDIAEIEQPFEGEYQLLWVNWEDERNRYAGLKVGRENISPETVFKVIHTVAIRQKWGRHFSAYQRVIDLTGKVEQEVAKALSSGGDQDEFAALRGIGASALAKIVRMGLPVIGTKGEKLAQVFLDVGIKVSAEKAAQLRTTMENHIRARLKPEQFNIFLNPHEQLARSLADGLKRVADRRPLIIFLDTYEIVDRADTWLRMVIQSAGSKVMWVLSGRDDLLRSRQFGEQYLKGYAEEFPRRLLAYDIRQLALEDVSSYFAATIPQRPLDEATAEAISRATRGIPLAIIEAADMWGKGTPIEDIVGDITNATPRGEIVGRMTYRYLLHVDDEADKLALYALALAGSDVEILRAMLHPDDDSSFDLDARLRQLERDYSSVYISKNRLHDEPSLFFLQHLREERMRTDKRVRQLNQRAVDILRKRLRYLEVELPLIEERCEDDEWVKTALDITGFLFWLDETEAWKWLIPRFVEGLAYSRVLRRGLLQIAEEWKGQLSTRGKKRLKLLRSGSEVGSFTIPISFPISFGSGDVVEVQTEMLDEIERMEELGWLAGEGEAERLAILTLRRGRLLYRLERYDDALRLLEQVEEGFPNGDGTLKAQAADTMEMLANGLIWPRGKTDAVYSSKAEDILWKVLSWLPERHSVLVLLGATLCKTSRLDEAICIIKKAIELDPNYSLPHNILGILYCDFGRYDDAIIEYLKAIELDPMHADSHNNLGIVYRYLGRYDDAMTEYLRAIELDPKYAYPHNNLAEIYMILDDLSQARYYLNECIRLEPDSSLEALVSLGIIALYQDEAGSKDLFQRALDSLETAQKERSLTKTGLLENEALALLCLGRREEALVTLHQALEQRLPGDIIGIARFKLIKTAPNPPAGIDEMIDSLRKLEDKRALS